MLRVGSAMYRQRWSRALRPVASRAFSSSGAALEGFPLTQELPGMPGLRRGLDLPKPTTRVTTLDNGLRVASEELNTQASGLGLFIEAGSMYERPNEHGLCHLLENLAFKSSENLSGAAIAEACALRGLTPSAMTSRDALVFRIDCLRNEVDFGVQLLADTARCPLFATEELEEAKVTMGWQVQDVIEEPMAFLQELTHEAAYGPNTPLGHSVFNMPAASQYGAQDLRAFMSRTFTPDRMVLAASAVDHDEVVAAVERYFADMPARADGDGPVDVPDQAWVGGLAARKFEGTLTIPAEMSHISVALPSAGWVDDDVFAVCILDTLLGGGSSFSAGGPGKGMYTRIYNDVLRRHHWVESMNAWSLQFLNHGIFGISGAAIPPQHLDRSFKDAVPLLAEVIVGQLHQVATTTADPVAFNRAKNMLKSSIMMNLETRGVLCEDIGRQVLGGERIPPSDLLERVEATTAEDIRRVAAKALKAGPPALAVYGFEDGNMPATIHGLITEAFAKAEVDLSG